MGKLQYKDDEGNIGEGQKMTDLERNNRILWYFAWLLTAFFIFIVIMVIYIMKNNVVNNIVNACV